MRHIGIRTYEVYIGKSIKEGKTGLLKQHTDSRSNLLEK